MQKSTEISRLLHQIARKYNNIVISMQSREGIDPEVLTRSRILGYLIRSSGRDVYQKNIEKDLNMSKSAVSNIITELEAKGVIGRVSIRSDARYRKIVLTEAGEEAYRRIVSIFEKADDDLIRGMTEEETEVLTEMLNTALKNLKETEEGLRRD